MARTRSAELFVAACLLVVIATGLATAAAGLSMALGALIGGMLLAVTEYRRQVEVTIEPFKGLFVGVFLISIGMSLDIRTMVAHPLLVFGGAVAVVLLKLLIVAPAVRAFGLTWATGLQTGLLLGPGGEFGFVIVSVALGAHLLAPDTASEVLFVTALTMATIPLLSNLGSRLVPRLTSKTPVDPDLLVPETSDALARVIVAGFGRVGQTVAALLEKHRVPYVAVDSDPRRVAAQRKQGKPVYFGDMTQIALLRRVHLDTARALVVTLDDTAAADVTGGWSESGTGRSAHCRPCPRRRARGSSLSGRRFRRGAGDYRGQFATVRIEDRGLDGALQEVVGVTAEELVERVLARDVYGQAAATAPGAPPHLPQRGDGPGERDNDGRVELADVDPELERVGRDHRAQLAADEPALELAALLGGVAGAVGGDEPGELGDRPLRDRRRAACAGPRRPCATS